MATHIVSVGTRGLDDFQCVSVQGFGPWTINVSSADSLFSTYVGDVVVDPNGRIYLITSIAADRMSMTVRDIKAAGGFAPFAGVALPVEANTGRAYSSIGAAEMDIPDAALAGDTWECHVYNDSLITESPVVIDDTRVGINGKIRIIVPDTERHGGTAGTGARWQQAGSGIGIRFNVPAGWIPAQQILEGLEIIGITAGFAQGVLVSTSAGPGKTVLRNLMIHGYVATTSGTAYGIRSDANGVDVINCLVYWIRKGFPGAAYGIIIGTAGGNARLLNCTVDQCYDNGIRSVHSGVVAPQVRNCAVFNTSGNIQAAFSSTNGWLTGSGNNCTDASTAPGTANLTSRVASSQFVSLVQGSENYHLKSTANTAAGSSRRNNINTASCRWAGLNFDFLAMIVSWVSNHPTPRSPNQPDSQEPRAIHDHSTFNSYDTAAGSNEDASFNADPKVVSKSQNDFHLLAGSPCINAGSNVGLTEDFDGKPISGTPDIGAFEF